MQIHMQRTTEILFNILTEARAEENPAVEENPAAVENPAAEVDQTRV